MGLFGYWDDPEERKPLLLETITWPSKDVMVRERVVTDMKMPWEWGSASLEWVQPSETDLTKLFLGTTHQEEGRPHPRCRRIYSEPSNALRCVDISPDLSLLTSDERKAVRRRGRSASCLLSSTSKGRIKETDFDAILRDLCADSLKPLGDQNNNRWDTTTKSLDNLILSKTVPDNEVWTDISLEDPTINETTSSVVAKTQEKEDQRTKEKQEASFFTSIINRSLEKSDSEHCNPRTREISRSRWQKKLFDQLLTDIYANADVDDIRAARRRSEWSFNEVSTKREKRKLVRFLSQSCGLRQEPVDLTEERFSICENITQDYLMTMRKEEILYLAEELRLHILEQGKWLVRELEERDALLLAQQSSCDILTAYIHAQSTKTSEDAHVKFSVSPGPGDTGFQEWSTAMKMVARLPDGVPPHFRRTLWLTLAEKHLTARGINWSQTERGLFSESCNPDDEELSVQIVKDLHRTGCSLFCGVSGQHNQAVLKRVLLAFARWNKNVGYCQGLNMLAALILQVMQGSQSSTVKVMIYLIEGVLPESYFGQNLRGLSVDMAVFRDLLRLKLPHLSNHLDHLQHDSKDAGTSYEPPLMDVFTMQWLLTIFSNCLPQPTVLRVWDILFLEGNEVLLKTALAIWNNFSERILAVRSADEFYSIMAVHTREMLEFGLMDPNNLIKAIDTVYIPEVAELREKYVYNITPWTVATVAKRGLKLLYDPYDSDSDDHFNSWQDSSNNSREGKMTPFSNHPDREKIALDISVLKKQYLKLRERQRQAHIIFTAVRTSDNLGTSSSPALNHLLLGKSALLSLHKGRRIEGTIPPTVGRNKPQQVISGETLHWSDADSRNQRASRSKQDENCVTSYEEVPRARSSSSSSSSSSSTELCDSSESESASPIPPDPEEAEPPPAEECVKRRNSERALMQILQENSEILRRIQSQSAIKSQPDPPKAPEEESPSERADFLRELKMELYRSSIRSLDRQLSEPDDIAEIRKKYNRPVNKQWSLDAPKDSKPTFGGEKPHSLDFPDKVNSFDNDKISFERASDTLARTFDFDKPVSTRPSQDNAKSPIDPSSAIIESIKPLDSKFDISSKPIDDNIDILNKTKPVDLDGDEKKPFSPFPRSPRRKSQLGVQLGLYSPEKDS